LYRDSQPVPIGLRPLWHTAEGAHVGAVVLNLSKPLSLGPVIVGVN